MKFLSSVLQKSKFWDHLRPSRAIILINTILTNQISILSNYHAIAVRHCLRCRCDHCASNLNVWLLTTMLTKLSIYENRPSKMTNEIFWSQGFFHEFSFQK